MPPHPRLQLTGVYHITSRGVDRQRIYVDAYTRVLFLHFVAKGVGKHPVACHAYCLMDNHFHLAIEVLEDGAVAPFMQYVNSTYARIFNEICGRRGYLFEEPYDNKPVESEAHAMELCRYVVLNPVRAGIRKSASDYRWSSYRATLGLAPRPVFLRTDWILNQFDQNTERTRIRYALFVEEGARQARPKDMSA